MGFCLAWNKIKVLDMKRIVEPGEFEVQVGKNSVEYLSDKFEVK